MKKVTLTAGLLLALSTAQAQVGFSSTQKYELMAWTIKKFEGYSKSVYACQAGISTVGWGFTQVKKVKNVHHADKIFHGLVAELYNQVDARYPNFTYLQKAAITSLLYNTGDLEKIDRSSFIKELKAGRTDKAAAALMRWNKVRVNGKLVTSKGLTNRRAFEARLVTGKITKVDYFQLKNEVGEQYLKSKR